MSSSEPDIATLPASIQLLLRVAYRPVFYSAAEESELPLHPYDISATLGGSDIYLSPEEEWPICPACNHFLIPIIQINLSSPGTPQQLRDCVLQHNQQKIAHGRAGESFLQFFACPNPEGGNNFDCFGDALGQDGSPSWVLRVAHDIARVEDDRMPSLASLAAQVISSAMDVEGSPRVAIDPDGEDEDALATLPPHLSSSITSVSSKQALLQRREQAKASLLSEELFKLPILYVKHWEPVARPELPHWEDMSIDVDIPSNIYDIFYPREGVKMLGWEDRGKYDCGGWKMGCYPDRPKDSENCRYKCLVQLGSCNTSRVEVGGDGVDLMDTLGNCWIAQCLEHPDRLELCMS
ncbi:hypothetical protein JAAARDRAFT_208880, partial [Jaapia argillacea MUCL 33604]